MSFSETVVKRRIPILIITLLLMIPAVLGMIRTRVNYDMLDYLPADMDTVIGQDELMKEFGKGAGILPWRIFPFPEKYFRTGSTESSTRITRQRRLSFSTAAPLLT